MNKMHLSKNLWFLLAPVALQIFMHPELSEFYVAAGLHSKPQAEKRS